MRVPSHLFYAIRAGKVPIFFLISIATYLAIARTVEDLTAH